MSKVWAICACSTIELFYSKYYVAVLLAAFYCALKETFVTGHVPVGVPDLTVFLHKYLNNSS